MGDDDDNRVDDRVQWIRERVNTAFQHLKADKIERGFTTEESTEAINDFLESRDVRTLVFDQACSASVQLPKRTSKGKTIVFLKLQADKLTLDTMKSSVLVNDISGVPLEHLEKVIQEVYLPLLSNPANQEGWGEVASKEILDRLHGFLANVSITVGATKGETCLPLPPEQPGAAAMDNKDRIHLLEGAVITWTKQVKSVLKQDPEGLLKQGLHPTPDMEIAFWKSKADNLNAIFEQLQSSRIRHVLQFLDKAKSTYCAPFARLCQEVFAARLEANDNVKYLRTLDSWFGKLNDMDDFMQLTQLFKPMMHILLLIWKNSKYYNTPARLVVLMREICNALINQARGYISGKQLFALIEEEEASEAVRKLKATLKVCGAFKTTYFDYKATANAECPSNPWRIQNNALFMRLDSFLERVHDILDLTQTIMQFSRLARIEVGGTKGKALTNAVQQIAADFEVAVKIFKEVPYDIMDVGVKEFDDDFYEFRCKIKNLERRLASLLTQGFDDCATIYGRFKLLDSFDGLLERPIIQDELERKHIALVQAYGQDLKRVQELFLTERESPPIPWNLPPIAGALTWCRGLKERITEPMVKLRQLNRTIMNREEAKEVTKVYGTIISSLDDYEHQKIEEWGSDVERSSQAKLKLPLLAHQKDSPSLLTVNFDPALVKLLREVKYFLLLGLEVPPSALEIYQKAETYRRQTGNLDLIVNMYNRMVSELLPVETPLMKNHFTKIDGTMQTGIKDMNWKSAGIDSFIDDCQDTVKKAHTVLFSLKDNLKEIQEILDGWASAPLLSRKSKPVLPKDFEDAHKQLIATRFQEIKQGGMAIEKKLQASHATMKVSKAHPNWRAYVDFTNGIVVMGLSRLVVRSLQFLSDQLDPEYIAAEGLRPLLLVKLDLVGGKVRFLPDVEETAGDASIWGIVNTWIDRFYQAATLFKRLDDPEGRYVKEMVDDMYVQMLLATINEHLADTEDRAVEYRATFEQYAHLWETDLQQMFTDFRADAVLRDAEGNVAHDPPQLDLDKYGAEITRLKKLQTTINNLSTPTDIGWLRITAEPVKQALATQVTKWIFCFTDFLQQYVLNSLNDLNDTVQRVTAGLAEEVPEADNKEPLKRVMAHIRDVKKSIDHRRAMFVPLRDTVVMLRHHGVSLDAHTIAEQGVTDYLETAPLKWDATVNATFKKKEEIFPLQTAEMENIKEEVEAFFLTMREFRNRFRKTAPFAFTGPAQEAYDSVSAFFDELRGMEAGAADLNELEELFELPVSKYNETTDTRNELGMLKSLWDFKELVRFSYDDWQTALWNDVDTEALEDKNKKLAQQLKRYGDADQIMKGWQVYRDLEKEVKNMSVSLPLVNDLHSPAMRPRHWKELARVCKCKSLDPTDAKFCLEDLLSLQLHTHADDVMEIVETASKELKIERKMEGIEQVWNSLDLDYAPHKDSDVVVVRPSDEVVEALEEHQMELQTIIGMGKFVDYFRDRVMTWQRNLGTVESVLREWVSVTKAWASLESIFLASADIRAQLPDDTKRFEGIDQEFKDLMKSAVETPNVVVSCTADGREEKLKEMTKNLELCQKSLNEYLDMKKKIFPRFYFVSNVALLDMLSNSNNPLKILPYLGDCFDSLKMLTMEEAPEGEMPSVATSMTAKDGEQVSFQHPFKITGAVENWLNDLNDVQNDTMAWILEQSIETAVNWDVEKPRHEWLRDYPAQIVLTAGLVYWTEETQAALDELEGGQEDSVKKYLQVCNERLRNLIKLVLGKLEPDLRAKIISLITIDVHSRDVVQSLIDSKAEGPLSFAWQQQLRFHWAAEDRDVNIFITDYKGSYVYEWVGNSGRLVITPLTDRCYITLTMALRLMLGGAPAGPAGTGKTETVKDLARACALPCYVFNCSPQMNFQTLGNIFKGLSQTGAWGCFDEFNRISIEVLSVVATQVKQVLDAIVKFANPANREEEYKSVPAGRPNAVIGRFELGGDLVTLKPTNGIFITMNPGYAGRTELPENIKALFRSCAMIRPDLALICENMLMSEGFGNARLLSVKFTTLYRLCSELLSPQHHYDWGLRAVKSVLRVAGGLKRAEPDIEEDGVLMRALRDFNTPKMPSADLPIFMRLIQDMFPFHHHLATKFDEDLQKRAAQACAGFKLQPDTGFLNKVVQLQELLDVRHSVMLLGPAGCAKSSIWRVLASTHNLGKTKKTCITEVVNPKAVPLPELYGYMTLAKEWKDGVVSIIMRGMSKNYKELGFYEYQEDKWIIFDGDIDTLWIESMNTVMDDNKTLTLVSNERIPLSRPMRLLFEISSVVNASPATVSRAGMLYINDTDVGWRPYVESWMAANVEEESLRAHLPGLFDKFVDPLQDQLRKTYKNVTPLNLINLVQTTCRLLEAYLPSAGPGAPTDFIDALFAQAVMWAFGGPLTVDKNADHRRNFHDVFTGMVGAIKYPKEDKTAMCFDYFFDPRAGELVPWRSRVQQYVPTPIGGNVGETMFSSLMVQTMDTVRLTDLLRQLHTRNHPVMFVGVAGTGKTAILKDYLSTLEPEQHVVDVINMNYYMDCVALQLAIEGPIDKRSGKIFGPPAGKKMTYYIDDVNLPWIEDYGTQNSLSLLRQVMDHGFLFDRADLSLRKEVVDLRFISSMNPTAGSFSVSSRLQRFFSTFCISMPSDSDLNTIFSSILAGHTESFPSEVAEFVPSVVSAALSLHSAVSTKFLPSASRFVYNWNMRELARLFENLCLTVGAYYPDATKFGKLFAHESRRVFRDRLVDEGDQRTFDAMLEKALKDNFPGAPGAYLEEPLIFTSFAAQPTPTESAYLPLPAGDPGSEMLSRTLTDRLEDYNSENTIMELVLFQDAMEHVCRIARIIFNPRGHAMLVGVGGSGKQSLSRLSAYICGYEVKQLAVTARFTVVDLQESLKEMYMLAGVKGQGIVFLMTDTQITNERFLVYVNEMLSAGWIKGLLEKDELENVFSGLRGEAKQAGIPDTADTMMEFFISRILRNLHVVLCFSPVGESFRVRARRFPGLINSTSIDWFHAWPQSALESVAARFLEEVPLGEDAVRDQVAKHMAFLQVGVTDMSAEFKSLTRRSNYVTPKSFLELIAFYKHLLDEKRGQVGKQISRLDVGLAILRKTQSDVAELQVDLEHTMVKVEEKKANTEQLLKDMGAERAVAEEQQNIAEKEAEKAAFASDTAAKIEAEASAELAEAKPAMEAAADAVNCLSKASLTELKSMSKPPDGVEKVTACCLMMLEGEYKNHAWDRAKKMMGKIDQFIQSLKDYRGEDMTEQIVERLTPFVKDPLFTQEKMASKSSAAANLCAWVVNIYKYNRIYVKVKPLMDALNEARANKQAAQAQLKEVQDKVAEVEARLKKLQDSLMEATEEKQAVEAQAQACTDRLQLAERLVNGLASENTRWGNEIEKLRQNEQTLVGDVMLASAFVSYIGAFDYMFRDKLWKDTWLPDLRARSIPMSEEVDPLTMLTDGGHTAKMLSDGLPADRISIENGSIVSACKRWPLLIDPQLQGIKWLRQREEARGDGHVCRVLQLTQNNWLRHITNAIQQGQTIIIENVQEDIDATLDPVLSRAVYKKGRTFFLQVGGEEVEYDPKFRLYLQSKLSNPHFKPEIQAQCTLVNFIATEAGLADQLLARVVNEEKAELEAQKQELQEAFNRYQIQLMELEDQLLERLSNAPEDILSDVPLIEGLEATKAAAVEIEKAVEAGKKTEVEINLARQVYVPVSVEGAMLYFMISQLNAIEHMYQYSLDAFLLYFYKAIREAPESDDDAVRVNNLRDTLRFVVYTWISRGLFERHKLILMGQLTFLLTNRGMLDLEVEPEHFRFLITGPKKLGEANPLAWLPISAWNALQALADVEEFAKLPSDMVEAPTRFMEWFNHVTPEKEKLPLDWARLDKEPFKKLMVLRCLRPDRLNVALQAFVAEFLPKGREFVECDLTLNSTGILDATLADSKPATPIFFILSAGADVVGDVEALAAKYGFEKGVSYHNVAMGQGQDVIAMEALEMGHKQGHWVLLNNVHLMPRWLVELEKKLDAFESEGSHAKFRVFLTGEPSKGIPIGILNRSIKLTNEPPSGLKANLNRAFASFSADFINEVEPKTRAILFGLCHFHAVLIERKKFGPIGYNIMYPFSLGDLRDSSVCLMNYMENAGSKIPWDDLRYIFGQIMYGGHIVNDFDRLLCVTYLEHFLRDELLDEIELLPYVDGEKVSFRSPNPTTHDKYLEHIEQEFPGDTPLAFGLHPNAEIGFRTDQSETTFSILQELQPRDAGSGDAVASPESVAETVMQDVLDRFGDTRYELDEIGSGEEKGPFQNVLTLECEQMNKLLSEMHRSLIELGMGFAGELTISDAMDDLMNALFLGRVPGSWARLAWPSLRNLQAWLHDLSLRISQLNDWAANPLEIPKVTWLSGMINPQSFLTAIAQQTAQKNSLELDKLVITTEVLKRKVQDVEGASRDGAYVHGFSVVGARWDWSGSHLDRSKPREMFCPMPVINCKAILADKVDSKGVYDCPVYKTEQRGPTYVFMAQLRSKQPSGRWVMAGVAMVLDVVV